METKSEYKSGCGYLECIATECKGCFTQKVNEPSLPDLMYLYFLLFKQWTLKWFKKTNEIHIFSLMSIMSMLTFVCGIYIGITI